ncbi:MAG TPA: O-antigen ligase family protein [Methylocystis sp.]|nr:O-antigen ligase family protein [Methylocystis sp.]
MTIAQAAIAPRRFAFRYATLINLLLWIFIFLGSFTFVEPSPYDVLSVIILPVWFFSGFRIHRSVVPFVALLFVSLLTHFLGLLQNANDAEATVHFNHTVYIYLTALFFSVFFAEDTSTRTQICFWAYAASCWTAIICGVLGWFDVGGTAETFAPWGRAQGPFKDPNVFGSYLVAGHVFLLQRLLLGQARTRFETVATVVSEFVFLFGIFLSFSRGSWGATALSTVLIVGMAFVTSREPRIRRRIAVIAATVVALAVMGFFAALSVESIREKFASRAVAAQDYDSGETGRFGNQLRSLPMLLERPGGMGLLGYRKIFDLDPHNSYIGAFANGGWIGGFTFLLLVGATGFVGFRLCFKRSPFQFQGQIVWTVVLMYFLQAFQIDIDHWRFFFLQLGLLWGLEGARQRYDARQLAAPRASATLSSTRAGLVAAPESRRRSGVSNQR